MRTKQDKTRRRIVEAAYESFWRSGFARASVDSIAERAGLTKRTLYSYFRSKDDLLAAVLQKYSDLAAERRQHIAARLPSNADGLIDSFFAQLVRLGEQHTTMVRIGLHPFGGRACGPARPSGSSHCTQGEKSNGVLARTATTERACVASWGPSARYHAADGRIDGAHAHSWRQALHRRGSPGHQTTCRAKEGTEADDRDGSGR